MQYNTFVIYIVLYENRIYFFYIEVKIRLCGNQITLGSQET